MSLSESDVAAVLEENYLAENLIPDLMVRGRPTLAMIKHSTEGMGAYRQFPVKYARPQGRATSFATALANAAGTKRADFQVSYVDQYQIISVDGPVLARSAGQRVHQINHVETEIDSAIENMGESFSRQLFGNGGGALGREGGTWTSGNVITLLNANSAMNFEVGMVITSSTTDGTSGSAKAGSCTVTDVDRVAGTVTVDNIAGITGTFAQDDYLFAVADHGNALSGHAAWIPKAAPTSTAFHNVDRTADAERLAGMRYDASSDTIEEGIIKLCAKIDKLHSGVKADLIVLSHDDYAALEIALSDRKRYVDLKGRDNRERGGSDFSMIGFGTGMLMANGRKVIADPDAEDNWIHAFATDSWVFETCGGEMVTVKDEDGRKVRYRDGSDALVAWLYSLCEFYCTAPGGNGRANLT